jgi:hypothetical protein
MSLRKSSRSRRALRSLSRLVRAASLNPPATACRSNDIARSDSSLAVLTPSGDPFVSRIIAVCQPKIHQAGKAWLKRLAGHCSPKAFVDDRQGIGATIELDQFGRQVLHSAAPVTFSAT